MLTKTVIAFLMIFAITKQECNFGELLSQFGFTPIADGVDPALAVDPKYCKDVFEKHPLCITNADDFESVVEAYRKIFAKNAGKGVGKIKKVKNEAEKEKKEKKDDEDKADRNASGLLGQQGEGDKGQKPEGGGDKGQKPEGSGDNTDKAKLIEERFNEAADAVFGEGNMTFEKFSEMIEDKDGAKTCFEKTMEQNQNALCSLATVEADKYVKVEEVEGEKVYSLIVSDDNANALFEVCSNVVRVACINTLVKKKQHDLRKEAIIEKTGKEPTNFKEPKAKFLRNYDDCLAVKECLIDETKCDSVMDASTKKTFAQFLLEKRVRLDRLQAEDSDEAVDGAESAEEAEAERRLQEVSSQCSYDYQESGGLDIPAENKSGVEVNDDDFENAVEEASSYLVSVMLGIIGILAF